MTNRESISEPELCKRWGMNPATFFFKRQNNQVPPRFLSNMTSRYLLSEVKEFEAKNGITVESSPER